MGRKVAAEDYAISLDIGNGSVGWAAFTPDYRLVRAKGHELIGARLFEPAQTAEARRMARTTRRRISRRRWRLRLLDALFDAALSEIDPSFLMRRKYSWVHPNDTNNAERWYGGILFDSKDQDKRFYEKYPTIYHLRRALMEDNEQHDIREVYVAVHHILKYRGNFLIEGELDSSDVFVTKKLLNLVKNIINQTSENELEESWALNVDEVKFADALCTTRGSRKMRADNALALIQNACDLTKEQITLVKAILSGLEGNKLDLNKIFPLEGRSSEDQKALSVYFNKADYEETRAKISDSGLLGDDECAFLDELQEQYSAVALKQLLGDSTSISESMCESYEHHHKNWELIKKELRTEDNAEEINRHYGAIVGWEIVDGQRKSIRSSNEDKRKKANKYFADLIGNSSLNESIKRALEHDIEEDQLFPIQRNSDNGVIPYQLHLNELRQILHNQGEYYPFLLDTFEKNGKKVNKIEGLLTFRVPYFVGPLVEQTDMQSSDNAENHWMKRKKAGTITPWNFDEMVDKDLSGRRFIDRLVGTDSYLLGEPTLPKNSMLYQEYEVLNELNNVRLRARSGSHWSDKRRMRLGHEEKAVLLDLFKQHGTVTKNAAENALRRKYGCTFELSGLSDEKKFTSSMSTYNKFNRIFGKEYVREHFDLMEQIVELQTVFEDKETLWHQLSLLDGLSDRDCDLLCKTHYTGWGRLSKKLLTTRVGECKLGNDFAPQKHSIIEIMRAEDRNFMEIITDKELGFSEWIDAQNLGVDKNQTLESVVDKLRISPKVKRGIIQSIRLIDDISKAVGKVPSRIFMELADDIQASVRTTSRKNFLLNLYKNSGLKKEFSDIFERLESTDDKELQDDRWFLYYTQLGKDMYTGKELNIDRLSSDYDIDHIIPQAVTQNDSLDNRVLVSRAANARKADSFAYLPELVSARKNFWQELLDNHLISPIKFERLTRQNDFGTHEKDRFVQRSLVETRQIMKNVATLLRKRYGNSSSVIGLNAELTKEMRHYLGFGHKNRDINDYHHAQDALCLGIAGQFAVNRGFFDNGMVSDGAKNSYNRYLQDYLKGYRDQLKAGDRKHGRAFGFVVGSMASSDENKRVNPKTGEIVWTEHDKEYLRRVMNYRKMLVTQKVGDNFGPLYNETRYGAGVKEGRDGIAFGKNKADTSLYGGFSSAKVVYSVLIELKKKVQLVNITMQEYAILGDRPSDDALRNVLVAKKKEYSKARFLLRHIPQMQLIRYNNAYMVIKSATELNNARQLWIDHRVYDALDDYLKKGVSRNGVDTVTVWDMLFKAVEKGYPLHVIERNVLDDARVKFMELSLAEQIDVLGLIVIALHADPRRANLRIVGLPSEWKRIRSVSFSDNDEFIFQSPSGLFEKRVTVAELRRKAK